MFIKNKLDEFQSHSIHYVMLAARSTEELRQFTETSGGSMAKSLQAVDACTQLGNEVKVSGQPGGGVFLMMDTRRFSQFTVTSFDIKSNATGYAAPGTSPNTAAQELAMTILDSQGISFANFLQFLMEARFGVSTSGMSVLIRIMFIGHTASGETKVVQSVGIPALFNEIQLDLNDTKGVYACKFISLVGVLSSREVNSKWTNLGTASSYFTGDGANTLGAVVAAFERRLNAESFARFRQYNDAEATTTTAKLGLEFSSGRPVQYMITLPKGWADYGFSGPAQGGAIETNFRDMLRTEENKRVGPRTTPINNAAPAKDSFIAVDPNISITEVLDIILSQTVQVMELGNFKKDPGTTSNVKFFKHLVSITSDDSTYTVHVDVVEFVVPNVELNAKTDAVGDQAPYFETIAGQGGNIQVPKNFLEYDYIFSGKNIDVLSLDLKIKNLNLMLLSKTSLGQGKLLTVADKVDNQQADGEEVRGGQSSPANIRSKDPVLFPPRTGDQSTNFSNLSAGTGASGESAQTIAQRYTQNSTNYLVGGSTDIKMTIRGNPDLLERVTLTSILKHVSATTFADNGNSKTNDNSKAEYRTQFEAELLRLTPGLQQSPGGGFKVNSPLQGPSMVGTPIFVKVNVFGPNVDFITNELIAGQDFGTRLFYDNYFFVRSIRTKIEGSKFTQEFELATAMNFLQNNLTATGKNTSTVKEIK